MSMHYMTTLHAWNSRLIPLFGFPLNVLLFGLILTKTPKEMLAHSRILLQTCVVDFIILLISLIAAPLQIAIPNSYERTTLFDGFLVNFVWNLFGKNMTFLILLDLAINIAIFFNIYSIPVQFAYRYLVLNKNISINFSHYILMLAFPFGASFIQALLICIIDAQMVMELGNSLKMAFNDHIDLQNSIYIIIETTNPLNIFWLLTFMSLCTTICYIVNIFCGIKMVAFVKSHVDFNPRMKELNRQLTKNLIILATFHLALCSFYIFYIFIYFFANIRLVLHVTFFLNMFTPWVIVVNAVVSIWINRPYRDAVKKLFNRLWNKNLDTVIHPIPAFDQ